MKNMEPLKTTKNTVQKTQHSVSSQIAVSLNSIARATLKFCAHQIARRDKQQSHQQDEQEDYNVSRLTGSTTVHMIASIEPKLNDYKAERKQIAWEFPLLHPSCAYKIQNTLQIVINTTVAGFGLPLKSQAKTPLNHEIELRIIRVDPLPFNDTKNA